MSAIYPVETRDWQVGDRAYCVREAGALVKGRVYRVASVIRVKGLAHTGLTFADVPVPKGYLGYLSNKVVRLRSGESALRQIDRASERTTEHYWKRA